MADQNNTPLMSPEQAQQLTDSGMLTPETANAFTPPTPEPVPPSTPENQALTEATNELYPKDRMENLMTTNGMSEAQARQFILAEEARSKKMKEEAAAEEQAALANERKQELVKLEVEKQGLLQSIKESKDTLGVEDPVLVQELDRINQDISDLQIQQQPEQLQQQQGIPVDPVNDELAVAQDNADTEQKAQEALEFQQQVEKNKNAFKSQLAQLQGEQEAIDSQRSELIEQQNAIFKDVDELKTQAKNTQLDPIWQTGNTGDKILAALAIGLGAFRAELSGGPNRGLQVVNQIIDREIQQNQQSFKNQLALKSAMLDKTRQQLSVLDSQTNSKAQKASILQMQEQLAAAQAQADQQLALQVQKDFVNRKLRAGQTTLEEEQQIFDSLTPDQQKQANVLRKDYENRLKETKIGDLETKVKNIESAAKDPSAAGDLALIFSYMKVLDPASVVREGEFATAASAGSVPSRITAEYNRVVNGQRLSETQRDNFLKEARQFYKNKLQQADKISKRFTQLAVSQGIPAKTGLGVRDFSLAASMPEEAGMELLVEQTGKSRAQIERQLEASGQTVFDFLRQIRR